MVPQCHGGRLRLEPHGDELLHQLGGDWLLFNSEEVADIAKKIVNNAFPVFWCSFLSKDEKEGVAASKKLEAELGSDIGGTKIHQKKIDTQKGHAS